MPDAPTPAPPRRTGAPDGETGASPPQTGGPPPETAAPPPGTGTRTPRTGTRPPGTAAPTPRTATSTPRTAASTPRSAAADALLFDALAESDETTPLDVALGRTLARLDPERGRALALAAALMSLMRRRGDSAVRLADWAGQPFPGTSVALPDAAAWLGALRASPAVAETGPLVLDAAGRVQFARDRAAEVGLAACFTALAAVPAPVAEPAALAPVFAALFDDRSPDNRQAVAAASALRHRLAVVAGGPGTGKTTTVVRMLALLAAARPGLRIALAAPTGKAANRLGASVADGAARLGLGGLPTAATTLHRLLDYSPGRRTVGRDAARPVPADVVVVDEASMVDLGLFAALVAALRPGARLILLGDRDQLPSVDAGSVFADLCAAADVPAADVPAADAPGEFSAFCEALGLPGVPEPCGPLAAAVVRLEKTYRYPEGSGLGALARALQRGDASAVASALGAADVHVDPGSDVWPHVRADALALVGAPDAAAALRCAAAFRVLTPTRSGPRGVHALNRLVESRLVAEGLAAPGEWMHGRPVLITRNDHDRALFNGDVGVVWAPGGAPPVVVFEPEAGGSLREVPVGALPEHETAWATTVHKSQGSEFDRVVVVLPAAGTPAAERLTRELVYTAVTRARGATPDVPVPLVVVGAAGLLAEAAARRETRTSAFPDALLAAAR